ncbi:uncharacterized protein [Aquarana catesbeiana]|uniref:uncharacterized protein n=1 Tax=Aquarana catesbeiana TaxID=8400 RepID=UPI003CCA6BBB
MAQWEDEVVFNNTPCQLELYKSFIDDIIIVWNGDRESLEQYLTTLNQNDKNISLTWKIDNKQIQFLDLDIIIENNRLITKTHFKEDIIYVYLVALRVTLSLPVVKPQTTLNYDKHIEAGIPGSVFCEINYFYPEAVKVRWVKYCITTATNSSLDRDVSLTIPLRNSDGTFNVTSLLTIRQSTGIEPGDVFFCTVSHRSLKEEMTLSFIMPSWSPLKDIVFSLFAFCVITFLTYFLKMYFKKGRRPWIYNVLRFIFIASCIIIVYLIVSLIGSLVATDDVRVKMYITLSGIIISYLIGMHFDVTVWRFFRLGEPSLSEISGDRNIPHMKRTTLTCYITNFRQKEIQINVYLKRSHEIKRPLIAKWDSTDRTSSNKSLNDLSIAGGQRDNKVHTLPLLEKGDESRTLLPVEMDVKMTKSWIGLYKCLCSITITPSADTDDGAVLAVEVEHASLKWPISVYRTLTVRKDNKPSLWRRCKKYVIK